MNSPMKKWVNFMRILNDVGQGTVLCPTNYFGEEMEDGRLTADYDTTTITHFRELVKNEQN